jgi:hypothetical protein
MSKIGNIVLDIMEKFGGNVPPGYTLEDYFRDEKRIKEAKATETSQESNRTHHSDQQTEEKEGE